jgi:hypothetical protein
VEFGAKKVVWGQIFALSAIYRHHHHHYQRHPGLAQ